MNTFFILAAVFLGTFITVILYFVVGIFIGMYHVSIKEDYDVSDFFGVMIFWPQFLWYRVRGKVWP